MYEYVTQEALPALNSGVKPLLNIDSVYTLLRTTSGEDVYVYNRVIKQVILVGAIDHPSLSYPFAEHGSIGHDNKYYFTPAQCNYFYRLDLSTRTVEHIRPDIVLSGIVGSQLYFHNCHYYNGYIYYVPNYHDGMARYHIDTDTMELDFCDTIGGSSSNAYGVPSFIYNGKMFITPHSINNKVVSVDLDTGVSTVIGSNLPAGGAHYFTIGSDGCMYTLLHHYTYNGTSIDKLIKVDPVSETWSYVGTPLTASANFPAADFIAVGDEILIVPRSLTSSGVPRLLSYNVITENITVVSSVSSFNGINAYYMNLYEGNTDTQFLYNDGLGSGAIHVLDTSNPLNISLDTYTFDSPVSNYVSCSDFGEPTTVIFAVSGGVPISNYLITERHLDIVGSVPSGIYQGQTDFILQGIDFLDSGATVELGDSSDYSTATLVSLTPILQSNTSISMNIDVTGLPVQDIYYFFVTSSIGQRNTVGYAVPYTDNIIIYSITPNSIYNGLVNVTIDGAFFGSSGAVVELCDSPDYEASSIKLEQSLIYQDDNKLIINVVAGTLLGFNYIHVTNTLLYRANKSVFVYNPSSSGIEPLILSFTTGSASDAVSAIFGGYGQDAVGRHQYGAPASLIEPRFDVSVPVDEEVDVSVHQWITFSTYHYSSIGDFVNGLGLEISEDGGNIFNPIASPTYELIKRVKDGQRFWFKVRKVVGEWPPFTYIVVRYTGPDEHGNIATKVIPIRWS